MSELEFARTIIFKKYPFRMAVLVLNELVGAVLVVLSIGAVVPLLGSLIDADGIPPGKIGDFITYIGLADASTTYIMTFLIVVVFVRYILDALRMYMAGSIGVHLNINIKKEMNHKMSNADWNYFIGSSGDNHGKYIQCMTVESLNASGAVNDLGAVVAYGVLAIILLGATAFFSFYILLIVSVVGLILFLCARPLMKKSHQVARLRIQSMSDLNDIILDNKFLVKLLKAEGLEIVRTKLTENLIEKLRSMEIKQLLYAVIVQNYNSIIAVVFLGALTFFYLGMNLGDGASLIFTLLLIQRTVYYFGNFQQKRRNMIQKIPSYATCMEVMDQIDKQKQPIPKHGKQPTLDKGIEFQNVTFSYGGGIQALKNISFVIPPHGVVALVGKSGGGKTTTIDMLMGLIRPEEGKIKIDGTDLNDIDRDAWKNMLAYLPQDSYLFKGTLWDNLTLGASGISDKAIWRALEKADCDGFVRALPDQLETAVNSGGNNFSGGERQRLSIARAILRGSRILIMDEPSSSLDKKTEKGIKNTVEVLGREKLIIIITHSLDFVDGIEHLYVINAGACLWEGSYAEMEKNKEILGVFAR